MESPAGVDDIILTWSCDFAYKSCFCLSRYYIYQILIAGTPLKEESAGNFLQVLVMSLCETFQKTSHRKALYMPMGLNNAEAFLMGLYARGLYTRGLIQGNNKISNFNFSCNVKLLQIIITAQQLMVSPNQSKGQIVICIVLAWIFILIVVQQLKFFLYKSLRHFVWNAINAHLSIFESIKSY